MLLAANNNSGYSDLDIPVTAGLEPIHLLVAVPKKEVPPCPGSVVFGHSERGRFRCGRREPDPYMDISSTSRHADRLLETARFESPPRVPPVSGEIQFSHREATYLGYVLFGFGSTPEAVGQL